MVVDDGVATGGTLVAGCRVARAGGAAHVVAAVPVASHDAVQMLEAEADKVVVVAVPSAFYAVGQFYTDFTQVDTETVRRLLGPA